MRYKVMQKMQVEINDMVIAAIQCSGSHLHTYANEIERSEEFSRMDSVGDLIREAHSRILTEIAIIKEFAIRCEKQKK